MANRLALIAFVLGASGTAQASFYDICEFDTEVKAINYIGKLGSSVSSDDNLGLGMVVEVQEARVRSGHTDCQGYVGQFYTVQVKNAVYFKAGDEASFLYDTKSGLTPNGTWFSDTWTLLESTAELPEQSAVLHEAKVDSVTGDLLLKVSYTGGCEEHHFTIDAGSCLETHPIQCRSAKLIHRSADECEAYITETVRLTRDAAGLGDNYFDSAFMTLSGSGGGSASFQLRN